MSGTFDPTVVPILGGYALRADADFTVTIRARDRGGRGKNHSEVINVQAQSQDDAIRKAVEQIQKKYGGQHKVMIHIQKAERHDIANDATKITCKLEKIASYAYHAINTKDGGVEFTVLKEDGKWYGANRGQLQGKGYDDPASAAKAHASKWGMVMA